MLLNILMILEPFEHIRKDLVAVSGAGRNIIIFLLFPELRYHFNILKNNEYQCGMFNSCKVLAYENTYLKKFESFYTANYELINTYKNEIKDINDDMYSIFSESFIPPFSDMTLFPNGIIHKVFPSLFSRDIPDTTTSNLLKTAFHNEIISKLDMRHINYDCQIFQSHFPYIMTEYSTYIENYEYAVIYPESIECKREVAVLHYIKDNYPKSEIPNLYQFHLLSDYDHYLEFSVTSRYLSKKFSWDRLYKDFDWHLWEELFHYYGRQETWTKRNNEIKNTIVNYSEENYKLYIEHKNIFD